MKNISKKWSVLALLLTATGIFAATIIHRGSINLFGTEGAYERAPTIGEEDENGEFVDRRREWFLQQRLFGSQEIPDNARERAKEVADIVAPAIDTDAANSWTPAGPQPINTTNPWGNGSGRINAIAVSPTDNNIVVLATATGGIWRSIDALASPPTFAPVSDSQVDLSVGSVAFAPSNSNIVYAGMGDGDNGYLGTGVLKSTDAGVTWAKVNTGGLPDQGFSQRIAVKTDDANTVFLARNTSSSANNSNPTSVAGFYLSTDGGATWTQTLNGQVRDFVVSPANANVIYAVALESGQAGATAAGIYKSLDAGATFNPVPGVPTGLAGAADYRVVISNIEPLRIYYFGGTEAQTRIQVAVEADAGNNSAGNVTWTDNALTKPQFDSGQFAYNTYLTADPYTAGRLYIGSRDIFRITINNANAVGNSEDLTNAWTFNNATMVWDYTPGGAKAHSDQQWLTFAGNANTFFSSNDGGLQRSTDAGATFTTNLNQSLSLTQIIGLAVNPNDGNKMFIGTQDNGNIRRTGGTNWSEFVGGDGGMTVLFPNSLSQVVTSYINGEFTRVDNDGTGAQVEINPQNAGGHRFQFYPPIATNGTDNTLYIGAERVGICTNCDTTAGVGNWTYTAADLSRNGDTISAIAVQKTAYVANGAQTIYVGTSTGGLQVSQDAGANYTSRSGVLDALTNGGRYITSIAIDPAVANGSTAYITVSGFGTTNHVFKTTDFGATITALNFTVDIPVNAILIDPNNAGTFFIGTDLGVFRSINSGAGWNQYNPGMPPVIVNRLALAPDSTPARPGEAPAAITTVAAGTYGRGVYFNSVAAPTAAPVTVSGRVTDSFDRSIPNAIVRMTDQNGAARSARTNSFGYFRFDDVLAGQTYIFSVTSKRYNFEPQAVTVNNNFSGLIFKPTN